MGNPHQHPQGQPPRRAHLDIVIKKEAVPQIDMLEIRSFLAWLRRS